MDLPPPAQPRPWAAGGKIPWHEPSFSERMLREHLSQAHDRASRRFERVDRHVRWLHEEVLGGRPSAVLDLGCGPGLYTERLAGRGHRCVGIDFAPAAIAHARRVAETKSLDCTYREEDLRRGEPEGRFDLVLLLFGELNTFPRADALSLLERARASLGPDAELVAEVHELAGLRRAGERAPIEYTVESGLFSDRPYRCLQSAGFDETTRTLVECHTVVDLESELRSEYVSTAQGYSREAYDQLFREAGLSATHWLEGLGESAPAAEGLRVVRLGQLDPGRSPAG